MLPYLPSPLPASFRLSPQSLLAQSRSISFFSEKKVFVVQTSFFDPQQTLIKAKKSSKQETYTQEKTVKMENDSSTLCAHLEESEGLANFCSYWIQGVVLCLVGIGGIVGNSVSG